MNTKMKWEGKTKKFIVTMADVDVKRLRRHLLKSGHIKRTHTDEAAISTALVIMSTNDGFIPMHPIEVTKKKP